MSEVIIALDFPDRNTTQSFLDLFRNQAAKPYVKIGMELFFAEGPKIVRDVASQGFRIFLDLKAHDIPNTVRGAMAQLTRLPVDLVNVHASGGLAMMAAAAEGIRQGCGGGKRPLVIAVTILTSIDTNQMNAELGMQGAAEDAAARLAVLAKKAGLDGVVCAPTEAARVHAECGADFLTVTPGVRFADADAGDQKRVVTPQAAREMGSDYIVVGRPITRAQDPVQAFKKYTEALRMNNEK
jgi:orotidine-5'-phosphate decarboxylase